MDTPILVGFISAAVAIVVPAASFYLTKKKEREAEWQRTKLDFYKELVLSMGSNAGTDSTREGQRRFAVSCNTSHLIASQGVLDSLHAYQDEIRISNPNRSDKAHDALLYDCCGKLGLIFAFLEHPR